MQQSENHFTQTSHESAMDYRLMCLFRLRGHKGHMEYLGSISKFSLQGYMANDDIVQTSSMASLILCRDAHRAITLLPYSPMEMPNTSFYFDSVPYDRF